MWRLDTDLEMSSKALVIAHFVVLVYMFFLIILNLTEKQCC